MGGLESLNQVWWNKDGEEIIESHLAFMAAHGPQEHRHSITKYVHKRSTQVHKWPRVLMMTYRADLIDSQ